jgi:hypothetical protein
MRPSADRARRLALVATLMVAPIGAVACAAEQAEQPPVADGPTGPGPTATGPTTSSGPTTSIGLDPDRLPVVVAAAPIPAGTPADRAVEDGLLESATVHFGEFPEDAVVTLDLLQGRVAGVDVPTGTIITAGDFVEPGDAPRRPDGSPAGRDGPPPTNPGGGL